MERSGLSAIATYVHHDRENLACLRVRDGVITLEKMFFDDEIRSIDGIVPVRARRSTRKQLKMAEDLISAYTSDFEPERYKDTYRERLLAIVDQKRAGQDDEAARARGGAVGARPAVRAHRVARRRPRGSGEVEEAGQEVGAARSRAPRRAPGVVLAAQDRLDACPAAGILAE